MKIWDNVVEVTSRPNKQTEKDCLTFINASLVTLPSSYLKISEEFLTSSQVEFISSRYRSCAHNIYYCMHASSNALFFLSGLKVEKDVSRKAMPKFLSKAIHEVAQAMQRAIIGASAQERKLFLDLEKQDFHAAFVEANDLRNRADYEANFEVTTKSIFPRLPVVAAELHQLAWVLENQAPSYLTTKTGKPVKLNLLLGVESFPNQSNLEIYRKNQQILLAGLIMSRDFDTMNFVRTLMKDKSLTPIPIHHYPFDYPEGVSLLKSRIRAVTKDRQTALGKDYVSRGSNGDVFARTKIDSCRLDIEVKDDGRFYLTGNYSFMKTDSLVETVKEAFRKAAESMLQEYRLFFLL